MLFLFADTFSLLLTLWRAATFTVSEIEKNDILTGADTKKN